VKAKAKATPKFEMDDNLKSRLNEIIKHEIDDIPVSQLSHSRILYELVE